MTITPPPLPDAPRRSRNVFVKHWRGELPFWVSFWIVGVLTNVVTALAAERFVDLAWFNDLYDPRMLLALVGGIWLVSLLLASWQIAGIWRSAARTRRERRAAGRGAFWVTMGCGLTVLGAVGFVWQLVESGVPQLRETWRMAMLGDPDIPPYIVRAVQDGTAIEISGGLKYGVDLDLRATLAAAPAAGTVVLDSPGGRIGEAQKLYATFREFGLVTRVPRYCLSACTTAFLGGIERTLAPRAVLGFHRGYFPGVEADVDDTQASFLLSKGIDRGFVARMQATPNDDMWFPTPQELQRAGFLTAPAPQPVFDLSGIRFAAPIEAIEAALVARTPVMDAIAAVEPAAATAIATRLHEGHIAGRTRAQLLAEIGPIVRAVGVRHWHDAADDTVLALGRMMRDRHAVLMESAPALCRDPSQDTGALFTADGDPGGDVAMARREARLYEQALWTSDPGHALDADARTAARTKLDEMRAEAGSGIVPTDDIAACRAAIALLDRILALGDDGVPVWRVLFEALAEASAPTAGY